MIKGFYCDYVYDGEPLAQAIYRQGKMGNDFNSSECKEEVAPSPSDITEERAANCLKIAGFYHRNKNDDSRHDPRIYVNSAD